MKKNKADFMLVILFFLVIFLFMFSLVKDERFYSKTENRNLNTFQHFTISNFLNNTYQKSLEDALSDQALGSETIKSNVRNLLMLADYNNIPKSICKDKYVSLGRDYYTFDCGNYILKKSTSDFHIEVEKSVLKTIEQYSELNDYIDTYYYFITQSDIYNFESNKYEIDAPSIILDNMKGDYKFDVFDFDNYEEYKKLFYKTDHHWNYNGSYKGYSEVMKLLKPNSKLLVPKEKVIFDEINFYGSASRMTNVFDFKETFKVYKFEFPEFDIINNGVENDTYGGEDDYFAGKYNTGKLINHYENFYGGDSGELIIDTHRNSKENLLIISMSFSNAINKLIASHFNETYIIDLRHYERIFNEEFEVYDYIEKNDIDKVLVIMNYVFLYDDRFKLD